MSESHQKCNIFLWNSKIPHTLWRIHKKILPVLITFANLRLAVKNSRYSIDTESVPSRCRVGTPKFGESSCRCTAIRDWSRNLLRNVFANRLHRLLVKIVWFQRPSKNLIISLIIVSLVSSWSPIIASQLLVRFVTVALDLRRAQRADPDRSQTSAFCGLAPSNRERAFESCLTINRICLLAKSLLANGIWLAD